MPNTDLDPGQGLHYLWHLQAIRLIEMHEYGDSKLGKDRSKFIHIESELWCNLNRKDFKRKEVKVAIIDNGSVKDHPNLPTSRINNAIEFAYQFEGTTYGKMGRNDVHFENLSEQLEILDFPSLDQIVGRKPVSRQLAKILDALVKQGKEDCPPEIVAVHLDKLQAPAQRFSAHGTACAGLVAADALPNEAKNSKNSSETKIENAASIPYPGVDRKAKIIPIATAYSHEYWPLIMALLYAVAQCAEVILIPRAIEEMGRVAHYPEDGHIDDPRHSTFLTDEVRQNEKELFETLLKHVSKRIPVVIAAGNSRGDELEYPAKLVDMGLSDLIVVGAVNAKGYRSSYSSTSPNDQDGTTGVTTYAPSDDGEYIDQEVTHYDELSWRGRRINMKQLGNSSKNLYSPFSILAIDVPGKYGYNGSKGDPHDFAEFGVPETLYASSKADPDLQPSSLYSQFGGTSAASSIVAGVVSLMISVSQDHLSPAKIKSIIRDASTQSMIALEQVPLVNRSTPDGQSEKESDKVGVLDANFALEAVK